MANEPTILIVEDQPTILAGLKRFFEMVGYQVKEASNLEAALKLYGQLETVGQKPVAVISDLQMPQKEQDKVIADDAGIVLFEELRKRDPHLPLILSSSKDEDFIRQQLSNHKLEEGYLTAGNLAGMADKGAAGDMLALVETLGGKAAELQKTWAPQAKSPLQHATRPEGTGPRGV